MKRYRKVIAFLCCCALSFQCAAAFSPRASIRWSKLGQYPYTWSYSGTVITDEYSSVKGDIIANAYAFDIANRTIAGSESSRHVSNVSSVTVGHGLPETYNTAWLGATVYGEVTIGQIDTMFVNATGANKSLQTIANTAPYVQLQAYVDMRDQAMVNSFHTKNEEYIQYTLFDYLNGHWSNQDILNGFDVLEVLDLQEGDSGLLLYESPDKAQVRIYKQDAEGNNHEYTFEIHDGYYDCISHRIVQSTARELNHTIESLTKQLAE